MLLRDLAKQSGNKKRIYPHLFRHSRATHLANFLTEAQMKQYFGWVQGSDMASIYVHLSGRDVDNALLRLNGVSTNENRKEEVLKSIPCPRCQEKNSAVSLFCYRCGSPLNMQIALQIEQTRASGDAIINELVQDSDIQELVIKKIVMDERFRERVKTLSSRLM